jgi:hypothetical protein
MKPISLMLAAISALAAASPLAAQTWHGDRQNLADLRMQLDAGIARGTITRREATTLRTDLNTLVRLERTYGRDGLSRSERETLMRRGASLQRMIQRAEAHGNRAAPRADGNETRGSGYVEAIAVGVGPGHRGDRFSGDLRVGQHVSDRQLALPVRYRARYQDDAQSYYRYDANRVYQIDRSSGLILAMFDVSN